MENGWRRIRRISLLLLILAAWWAAFELKAKYGVPWVVSLTLAALTFCNLWIWYRTRQGRHLRAIRLSNIDEMSGAAFEEYLAAVLTFRGYAVVGTAATGDLGVDLVAQLSGESIAIQVKRSAKPVSRRAVSDAVAGMSHYSCTSAMVITNGYFTAGAHTLADSTNCCLVDRGELSNWILEFQRKSRSYAPGPSLP